MENIETSSAAFRAQAKRDTKDWNSKKKDKLKSKNSGKKIGKYECENCGK